MPQASPIMWSFTYLMCFFCFFAIFYMFYYYKIYKNDSNNVVDSFFSIKNLKWLW